MSNVTPRIVRYVQKHFADAELILDVLESWRIPYVDGPPDERLVAAVVFVRDGSLERVDDALALSEQDWRDLLVAAGLEHDDWPEILRSRLGD